MFIPFGTLLSSNEAICLLVILGFLLRSSLLVVVVDRVAFWLYSCGTAEVPPWFCSTFMSVPAWNVELNSAIPMATSTPVFSFNNRLRFWTHHLIIVQGVKSPHRSDTIDSLWFCFKIIRFLWVISTPFSTYEATDLLFRMLYSFSYSYFSFLTSGFVFFVFLRIIECNIISLFWWWKVKVLPCVMNLTFITHRLSERRRNGGVELISWSPAFYLSYTHFLLTHSRLAQSI